MSTSTGKCRYCNGALAYHWDGRREYLNVLAAHQGAYDKAGTYLATSDDERPSVRHIINDADLALYREAMLDALCATHSHRLTPASIPAVPGPPRSERFSA